MVAGEAGLEEAVTHRQVGISTCLCWSRQRSFLQPSYRVWPTVCRAKLSDMGLSKRLAGEQLSFESVGSGGSSGWQAPEQLIGRSGGTARQTNSGEYLPGTWCTLLAAGHTLSCIRPGGIAANLTAPSVLSPAVDVFSFGLLLHYCLTAGQHPFGEQYERDANILQRRVNLKHLQHLPEAANLIRGCCEPQGVWRSSMPPRGLRACRSQGLCAATMQLPGVLP